MKLIGLVVMLGVTVLATHAFVGSSSPYSPLDPSRLIKNTMGGLCAAQQAVQAAADGSSFHLPSTAGGGLGSATFSCSTAAAAGH